MVGRQISDLERKILALPVRLGGIGIANPTCTADHEFSASEAITHSLTNIIYKQENNFENYVKADVEKIINDVKMAKMKDLRVMQQVL